MKRRDVLGDAFDQVISGLTKAPAGATGRSIYISKRRAPRRRPGRGGQKPNPGLEKYQQHQGLQLLSHMGSAVYVLGTRRSRGKECPTCKTFVPEDQGTRQTEGISDVLAFLPARNGAPRVLLFWEAKHADGGRLSAAQIEFRELCLAAAQAYCSGPLDSLIAWLIEHEYLNRNSVPHYRLPGAKP